MYYLFYYQSGEIIEFFDDIDDAISQFVLKRNELYSLRLYSSMADLTLAFIEKGDIINVLY